MKKILGILFGLMLLAMPFVSAQDVILAKTIKVSEKTPININGMSGEISIMTASGNEQAKAVAINDGNHYGNNNCQMAVNWAFDNAIDLKSNSEYKLNRQTCNVEKKVDYYKKYPCGKKVHWISRLSTDAKTFFGIKVDPLNETKLKTPMKYGICNKKHIKWDKVDITKPIQA